MAVLASIRRLRCQRPVIRRVMPLAEATQGIRNVERLYIRVTKRRETSWSVLRGQRDLCLLTFRFKAHAVAYARAVASAGKMILFVDNSNGVPVRQSSYSLTYPVLLD